MSQRILIVARVLRKPIEVEYDGDEVDGVIGDAASFLG